MIFIFFLLQCFVKYKNVFNSFITRKLYKYSLKTVASYFKICKKRNNPSDLFIKINKLLVTLALLQVLKLIYCWHINV